MKSLFSRRAGVDPLPVFLWGAEANRLLNYTDFLGEYRNGQSKSKGMQYLVKISLNGA